MSFLCVFFCQVRTQNFFWGGGRLLTLRLYINYVRFKIYVCYKNHGISITVT